MKSVTNIIMTNIFSLLFTFLACFGMAGCDNATPPEKPVPLKAVYELPEGWEWMDEENGISVWKHGSKDGGSPFVKFTPSEFPTGTQEEAKIEIKELYEKNMITCGYQKESDPTQECDIHPEYKEFLFDEIKVYASMGTGYVWGMESWTSVLGFEKDGRKAIFILYDKADLHMEELKLIISTLKFVER